MPLRLTTVFQEAKMDMVLRRIFTVCDAFEGFPAMVRRLDFVFHFIQTRFDASDLRFCLFVKQGV